MDHRAAQAAQAAAILHPIFRRSVVQIIAQRTINAAISGQRRRVTNSFLGSGFIIHKKEDKNRLFVITCWHVIEDIKPGQRLMVRLPGTTLDFKAEKLACDNEADIYIVSVSVPRRHPVTQFPCVVFSPAPAAPVTPVGTIVALMGYYNPIEFPTYLGIVGPLFATEPSAYGGCIVGPEEDTDDSGIIIQHNCYGIRGASGGPLVQFDTRRVIGVFTSLTETVGEAVSTECLRGLLGTWIQGKGIGIDDNDTIQERIATFADLYLK